MHDLTVTKRASNREAWLDSITKGGVKLDASKATLQTGVTEGQHNADGATAKENGPRQSPDQADSEQAHPMRS